MYQLTRGPEQGAVAPTPAPIQKRSRGGAGLSYQAGCKALSSDNQPGYDAQRAALSPNGPVQCRSTQDAAGGVRQAAAHGTKGGGGALPFLSQIQNSFGKHDISGVKASVGGPAKEACESMGAEAYASGNSIAFKGSPTLHTAAHEAAHIIQQRAGVSLSGGVGKAGDKYERHADAVADLVVQGKSAEGLLDSMAGSGGGAPSSNVQRKTAKARPLSVMNGEVSAPVGTGKAAAKLAAKHAAIAGADASVQVKSAIYDPVTSNHLITVYYPAQETKFMKQAAKIRSGPGFMHNKQVTELFARDKDKVAASYRAPKGWRVKGEAHLQVAFTKFQNEYNGWVPMANLAYPAWARTIHMAKRLGFMDAKGNVNPPKLTSGEVKLMRAADGAVATNQPRSLVEPALEDYRIATGEFSAAYLKMRRIWSQPAMAALNAQIGKAQSRKAKLLIYKKALQRIGWAVDVVATRVGGFSKLMRGATVTKGGSGSLLKKYGSKAGSMGLGSLIAGGLSSAIWGGEIARIETAIGEFKGAKSGLALVGAAAFDAGLLTDFETMLRKLKVALKRIDQRTKAQRQRYKEYGQTVDAFRRDGKNKAAVSNAGMSPLGAKRESLAPKMMYIEALRETAVFAEHAYKAGKPLVKSGRKARKKMNKTRKLETCPIIKGKTGEKQLLSSAHRGVKRFDKLWGRKLPVLRAFEQQFRKDLAKVSGNLSGSGGDL